MKLLIVAFCQVGAVRGVAIRQHRDDTTAIISTFTVDGDFLEKFAAPTP
jgi:hypothetical protein